MLEKIQKNYFFIFAIEMAVLSVFWQKKDLGPLRVKNSFSVAENFRIRFRVLRRWPKILL